MPFLAEGWRSTTRAVKDAVLAFIAAQRRSLTEEARGLSAVFPQEGQEKRENGTDQKRKAEPDAGGSSRVRIARESESLIREASQRILTLWQLGGSFFRK